MNGTEIKKQPCNARNAIKLFVNLKKTQNFLQESKLDSMFIRSVMHMSVYLPLAVTGTTKASVFRC